jgi:S-adenosylmethionine-diacylglycerol 3-amino-3-carboxypropyl transferase
MKRWLFDQIHKRNLIYNQCWEDPSLDHEALEIGPGDRIVTITSAGCNALDYLLRGPEQIDCVDLNPHQTALLELKLVALQNLKYTQFHSLFGLGRIRRHREIYGMLRPYLTEQSRESWDAHIDYFDPNGSGLYYHGTSGFFARILRRYIDSRPDLSRDLAYFQDIQSLEQQAVFYRRHIAPALWTPALRWFLRRTAVMGLLGVPVDQIQQMRKSGIRDLSRFIEDRVEQMFTTTPVSQNYFWRVYLKGHYTAEACPNYLRRENFQTLQRLSHRIRFHTMSLVEFLRKGSGPFSIFVLSDHMDWLTSRRDLLEEEWEWILRTSQAGARIIYRSGGQTFDYLPAFAKKQLRFESELTARLSLQDRVGTYGSFHLARVLA